ncbi:hypothetical protein BASA60_004189 [Batrachochytrium salamandrivorans]|nr:hypothetical protein BASA60_004189 [Batrachochytrium salamandrivorans]
MPIANFSICLEARSYQPGLNSYKELATSTLIKRRGDSLESPEDDDYEGSSEDNSEGSVGDNSEDRGTTEGHQKTILKDLRNSGSDSSPPPATTPHKTFHTVFTKSDVSSENLASTIDSVGDGMLEPAEDGKKSRKKDWWRGWKVAEKSGLGEEKYSKVKSNLKKKFEGLRVSELAESQARVNGIWNILDDVGFVIENVENIFKTATAPCYSTMLLLLTLKSQLSRFESGHTLSGHLDNAVISIGNFLSDQDEVRLEIMKQLKARFPIVIPPTHPNSE